MSFRSNTTPPEHGAGRLAFIGLGSNLPSSHGSPARTVMAAMQRLSELSVSPIRCSSLWLSKPEQCPPGSGDFINAVVGLEPLAEETPLSLLDVLLALEHDFGRQRPAAVNAPRTLDLDLICFADRQYEDSRLVLPHPRATQRGFVLIPLAEIAPGLRLPGATTTVSELAARMRDSGQTLVKFDQDCDTD